MPARNFQRFGPDGSAFLSVPMSDAAEVRASGSKRKASQFNQSKRPATFRMKSIHDILPEMHRPDEIFAFRLVGHVIHKARPPRQRQAIHFPNFFLPGFPAGLDGFEPALTSCGYII